MTEHALRVHAFVPFSRANGPGLRAVLWVQGCSLGCPGCYNPQTHPLSGGQLIPVAELFRRIADLANQIEGVTISGGEPLQQRAALLDLLRRLRRQTRLSIIVFTGFTWEEVQRMPEAAELLACVDVLIAGRYDQTQRLARDLRGSANKTVHLLTGCYRPEDLTSVPTAEVIITPRGELQLTGIDPLLP
ncbi:MAG TPA: 4Fe-4S single cluster domain-containing protein [Gemmataceae bacterium]|nr:4Fe-4S single cluster domain-containing protein [Gemmataceae bacterium]